METINRSFDSLKIDVLSLEKIKNLNEFNSCMAELESKTYFYLKKCCDDYVNQYILSLFNDVKYVKLDDFNYKILYKHVIIGTVNLLYKKLKIFNFNIDKDIFDNNYSFLMTKKIEKIENAKLQIKKFEETLSKPTIVLFFELLIKAIKEFDFSLLKNINQIKLNAIKKIDELQTEIIKENTKIERIKIKKEEFFKDRLKITKDFIVHCEGLGMTTIYKNIDSLNVLDMIEMYVKRYYYD